MMKLEVNHDYVKRSCDHFGVIDTSMNAAEECAELIQCVSKQTRGTENRTHMEEEIGDVLIAIENLIYIYDLDPARIQAWINLKQRRQIRRTGKEVK